jgi:ankyrin repeat protein
MNIIWSTTIDEIKNDILSPYYDDDTSTPPPPPVVINDEKTSTTLIDAHTAGKIGDISALIAIATKDIMLLQIYDNNGWTPLHEAARGGHLEAVKFLIDYGLDKVSRYKSYVF